MADQGGLSDALRHLAESKSAPSPQEHPEAPVPTDPYGDLPAARDQADSAAPQAPGAGSDEPHIADPATADAAHENHDYLAQPPAGAASSAPRPPAAPAHDHLKIAAVPVLAVVGLLLLVPGVWAVCLIAGIELWTTRTPEAVMMAWIMLICWPIAITLLVSAVVIFRQLHRGP